MFHEEPELRKSKLKKILDEDDTHVNEVFKMKKICNDEKT